MIKVAQVYCSPAHQCDIHDLALQGQMGFGQIIILRNCNSSNYFRHLSDTIHWLRTDLRVDINLCLKLIDIL